MVKIRKANAKDFEEFHSLLKENLENNSYKYPAEKSSYILNVLLEGKEKLEENISKGKFPLYVADEDGEVTGYFLTEKPFAGVAFGYWLGVARQHRGKGVGSQLLDTWEADIVKDGTHAVFLYTTENNVTFYKKRGYALGGTFPKSWFSLDHLLFYKHLK